MKVNTSGKSGGFGQEALSGTFACRILEANLSQDGRMVRFKFQVLSELCRGRKWQWTLFTVARTPEEEERIQSRLIALLNACSWNEEFTFDTEDHEDWQRAFVGKVVVTTSRPDKRNPQYTDLLNVRAPSQKDLEDVDDTIPF